MISMIIAKISRIKKKVIKKKVIKKKRILFIYPKRALSRGNAAIHSGWVEECKNVFIIDFWGQGWGEYTLGNLYKKINEFKPDYIYLTNKYRYRKWLPDLSSIKNVPKIFVEVDTLKALRTSSFYEQFDYVYCRMPHWGAAARWPNRTTCHPKKFKLRISNMDTWIETPQFRWSIAEKNINIDKSIKRKGINFVGAYESRGKTYTHREYLKKILEGVVTFGPEAGKRLNQKLYYEFLNRSSALLCPSESGYGNYVPAKIYEYAASGAAILTNCDLIGNGLADLDKVVIRYSSIDELIDKLNMDFKPYHSLSAEIMRNHTHTKRYKEIFV